MYKLTDSQRTIVEKIRCVTEETIAPHATKTDADSRYPEESINALRREGFMGLLVSKEYGGMNEDLRTMVAVVEEIAKVCSSTALCYVLHLAGIAACAAAKRPLGDVLQAAANGKHLSTLALGEFGSRSHFWAPVSQEKADNGKLTLNASKAFVTSADHADGYVVITRSRKSEAPTETTVYYIFAGDLGIRVSGSWDALGMRGNASAPVVFKDVELSPDLALTQPGKGMDLLLETLLPIVNLGVASICTGISLTAIEITKQHILNSELRHLGLTLADLPNERARLARMRLEIDKARAHLAAVLDCVERAAPDATLMVLESKAAAADMVSLVTDVAMKAAGGHGFNRRLGLERCFRDARAAAFLGITSDALLEFIGRALCGMPVP